MSYFTQLNYPQFPLQEALDSLIESGKVYWPHFNQICINTIEGDDSFLTGCGSLAYDWDKSYKVEQANGNYEWVVPERPVMLQETQFTKLCSVFKGTAIEDMYNMLTSKHRVGRIRFMRNDTKTCLSWHYDYTPRIHYPIKTQEGCLMIVEDEVKHMPQNTWWYVDTTKMHTALNASKENRTHIVAVVIGDGNV